MKVSIITPTYNSAGTLSTCLRSVSRQTHPDIEHIIVDGGSTDGTIALLEGHTTPQDFYWESESDNGIYDAINKGISRAKGDIIAILNSDDFYHSDHVIANVVEAFQAESNAQIVYGDLLYVDKDNTRRITRVWHAGHYTADKMRRGWHPPHPSFFVRASAYQKYGRYLVSPELSIAADYELMLRLLYKHHLPFVYLPTYCVSMRTGGASRPTLRGLVRNNKQCRTAWLKNNLKPPFLLPILKPLSKATQVLLAKLNRQ